MLPKYIGIHLFARGRRGGIPLEDAAVAVGDDDDGELDVAEVLNGDDHVVEHGEVLAVHAEQTLEGRLLQTEGSLVDQVRWTWVVI